MAENIGDRIGRILQEKGIKKIKAAELLNIDQSYVTQLVNCKRNPSDRTVSDICRVFNVNEHWLRTGEGEMFNPVDPDEEFAKLMVEIQVSGDEFIINALKAYWELPEEHKEIVRGLIRKISGK